MTGGLLHQAVTQLAGELAQMSGRERAARLQALASSTGTSIQTVYRYLARAGVKSGRAVRSDRGRSAVSVEALEQIAGIMATGRNKRGQVNIPLKQALAIAVENGIVTADVSYEHVARLMREAHLDRRRMCAPELSVARVSTHPNHVWQFDISVAIQWYFRDEAGKKLGQHADAGARFYPGKLDNIRAIRRVIHRYTVVDHYTGAYWVQYKYTAGETAIDVVDFLWTAFAPKEGNRLPMHGLPRLLVADQGPGTKNALVTHLLRDLDVELELHASGNAKASGAVEKRHDLWQRTFEGRLSLRPAESLPELNRLAALACAKMCAEVPHTRHGQPPSRLWFTIDEKTQLREPPDLETYRSLAHTGVRIATVDNYGQIRVKNRRWALSGAGLYGGQKVQVRLHPYLPAGIRVWDEHDAEFVATPLTFDAAGFPEQGKRQVWHDPEAKGATQTPPPAQVVAKLRAEDPMRLERVFDDLTALAQMDIIAKREGRAFTPPAGAVADIRDYDALLAREEAVRRLGRALTRDEARWWRQAVPEAGVSRRELDELWATFTTSVAAVATG